MSFPQDVKPYVTADVNSSASDAHPAPAPLFRLPTHHHFDSINTAPSFVAL
ncbi:hypothetical protein PCANC_28115 [Puccinia coronata f. sp. avenae]|uniref:Uncharacterized protein n=1 Tax=Puccinia coronata f. sp. avenae TaxID=200324 RepID=A0A2N5TNY4_9BASI|nr:hypothetical protein PCANC_28115 [Puccinia coronata f. sp. avenae]